MTAPLVYVNYGNREDYEELDRLGISVKGAIVIARYGARLARDQAESCRRARRHRLHHLFRSQRATATSTGDDLSRRRMASARRSAAGQRHGYRLSRRSVDAGRRRHAGCQAPELSRRRRPSQKVPVLPISYADATPLSARAEGSGGAGDWRGALPITYHVGPGPAKVHLKVMSNWDMKPVYDVIATLKGSDDGQWVIRGNHHDAWVNGADDPISGRQRCWKKRGLWVELHRQGWTPKRTIIYCAWDGEEPGLLGSVEWVETHVAGIETARRGVYQFRRQRARLFSCPAVRRTCRASSAASRASVEDPGDALDGLSSART